MDESTRLRMRRAHANHITVCECGKRLGGNGWRTHARSCVAWLERNGYPVANADREALRSQLTFDAAQNLLAEVGRIRAEQIKAGFNRPWGWRDYSRACDEAVVRLGYDR